MTIRACRWAAVGLGVWSFAGWAFPDPAWAQLTSPKAKLGLPDLTAPEIRPAETPSKTDRGIGAKLGGPLLKDPPPAAKRPAAVPVRKEVERSPVKLVVTPNEAPPAVPLPELPALPFTDGPSLFTPESQPDSDSPKAESPQRDSSAEQPILREIDAERQVEVISSSFQAGRPYAGESDDVFPFLIQLAPPGPQRLFRLESEEALRERIKLESRTSKLKLEFPKTTEYLPEHLLPPREWPLIVALAEPNYVCHRRLWFEQRNFERYGWDLGPISPGVSLGLFYADVAAFPLHWILDPLRWWDCNSGLCLPGDPVALRVYPPWSK